MEAHALTVRLLHPISFPFLVLLVSGGHCILLVCEAFGRFFRLGQTLDDSPGEALDKVSRMLRLHLHPLGLGLPGGAAVENISNYGDPLYYQLPHIMSTRCVCNTKLHVIGLFVCVINSLWLVSCIEVLAFIFSSSD